MLSKITVSSNEGISCKLYKANFMGGYHMRDLEKVSKRTKRDARKPDKSSFGSEYVGHSANSNVANVQHLSWKCIDDFDKVSNKKMFYVGDVDISERQRNALIPIFKSMKERYTKEILEAFSQEKTRLVIAGGSYTYYFVLPHVFKWVKQLFPHLSVDIKLLEVSTVNDLLEQDADMILTTAFEGEEFSGEIDVESAGYFESGHYYDDEVYLATSKDVVEKFGSKEEALKNHDILFGRALNKPFLEHIAPFGRQNDRPRVIVDQYILDYLFMRNSVGIGHVFKSMDIDDVVVLTDRPLARIRRFFIYKKDLDKKYHKIGRRVINFLKQGE